MAKNMLVSWLNDAYAMEQAQVKMLERFIKDFEGYPDISNKLEQHLAETKEQAETVKDCLKKLGGDVSKVKSVFGSMMGAIQGISTEMYKDELVKNMIILHAGEHFEHASYLALVSAANKQGEEDIAGTCMNIAEQEKATADWCIQQLPRVTDAVMSEQKA